MAITERVEKARQNYVNVKPHISYERAELWTESFMKTEGEPMCIRTAKAFYDTCDKMDVHIFDGELIVGATGEFRKCGILTPEFSWKWVDKEMDTFDKRPQDPYDMTDEQRDFVRKNIFPYWKGKSLEEHFLAQIPESSRDIVIDTGIVDSDSKWRQAVGEVTPDYQDVIFKLGWGGIVKKCEEKLSKLEGVTEEDLDRIDFYNSVIISAKALLRYAERYADEAERMASVETDPTRKEELIMISANCRRVPENPPETFYEAIQMLWFTQVGGVLNENPLSLNPGRFDQYMYPYYKKDKDAGMITEDKAQELIECLWLKYSEWVWTISANTADYFAGYNQFQNLTVGGRTREGLDATNDITYMALKATEEVKTHQPGLSVKIHPDCPEKFMGAVTELISKGTGFPAVHNDQAGYQMLINAGYEPEDARDWNNCGCVVPHFRKTGEWTAAVNLNFGSAIEFALNEGKQFLTGKKLGLDQCSAEEMKTYEDVEKAFLDQLGNLVKHSIIATITAQRLHEEMVPRPYLSATMEQCLEDGVDLSRGGAKYNVGPVITGIGLAVSANSLAAIKKLVFEDKVCDMKTMHDALAADWEGYEDLRALARAVPKYGNDDAYVDNIAIKISNYYYEEVHKYTDVNGSHFNPAFMGISNYIPAGRVCGATPDGRKATTPLSEGVSPFTGSDESTPIAAMRSAAKVNHDVYSGGTLLNMRLDQDLVSTKRGQANLGNLIRSYFQLGAFHVQFNTVSNEVLHAAQKKPDNYKDLLVRVAGYSTQFVNLSRTMQDAIIARNAHKNY